MKIHHLLLGAGMLVTLSAAVNAKPEPVREIHEASPQTPIPTLLARRVETPTPVSLNKAEAFRADVNIHELALRTEMDIAETDAAWARKYADVHPGPERFAVRRAFEPGPLSIHDGSALELDSEGTSKVWTLKVRSLGAHRIRLHFTQFNVSDGSVIVYADGEEGLVVRGPYSGRGPENDGDFWTSALPGDEAIVEVTGKVEPRFEITEVIHFDRSESQVDGSVADEGPPLLDCHLDVNCYGGTVHDAVKNATGLMFWDGGSCTGTLLTDNDGETTVPYFITARHCLSTQAEVDTLEVYWGYETTTCDNAGTTVPGLWTLPTSVGGTLVKTDSENDMTFIRLNSVPAGATFAGWTTATTAGEYGVHHPKGSWKRVVLLEDASGCLSCNCRDITDYDYYDAVDGLTQKGSSGSGVFTSDGKFAGQLYGVCSIYHSDGKPLTCSNISDWANMYGQFETSWSTIGWWLLIGGTVHVDPARANPPFSNGTWALPYATIEQAINIGWPELRVKIEAGEYATPLTFDKPMKFLAMNGVVTIGG